MFKKNVMPLLWAGLVLASMQLTSCASWVEGSFDTSREKETGPSALSHDDNTGLNVALEWMFGLNGAGTQPYQVQSSSERVEGTGPELYRPEDMPYTAAPAAAPANKDGIRFGTELEFVQKGSKTGNFKTRLNYLEGQGDVLYLHSLPNGDAIVGGLGPYIAYGVGGKTGTIDDFGGTDGYKRFDAGLNIKAAYTMALGLRFGLGYDLGLADKSTDPSDFTSRNRSFSVSVGYSIDKIVRAFKK
jgi:hypothetical protein